MHAYHGWQEHFIYGVYVWYYWQENDQVYGHIRRKYTPLTNPNVYPLCIFKTAWLDAHSE